MRDGASTEDVRQEIARLDECIRRGHSESLRTEVEEVIRYCQRRRDNASAAAKTSAEDRTAGRWIGGLIGGAIGLLGGPAGAAIGAALGAGIGGAETPSDQSLWDAILDSARGLRQALHQQRQREDQARRYSDRREAARGQELRRQTAEDPSRMRQWLRSLDQPDCKPSPSEAGDVFRLVTDQSVINLVCSAWFAHRSERLATVVREHRWVATGPIEVRIASALKADQPSSLDCAATETVRALIDALDDDDGVVRAGASSALTELSSIQAVDAICDHWVRTRDHRLYEIIAHSGYLPASPPELRIMVALSQGPLPLVKHGGSVDVTEDDVPAILDCLHSQDLQVADNAMATLAQSSNTGVQNLVCRAFTIDANDRAREAALAGGYAPYDPVERALFYFLCHQWAEYEELDFDATLLRAAVRDAPDALRKRVIAALRSSGRADWLPALTVSSKARHVSGLTTEEWAVSVDLLTQTSDWARLWKLASAAPLSTGVPIIHLLSQSGWMPTDNHEQQVLRSLCGLADALPPVLPDQWHYTESCSFLVPGWTSSLALGPGGTMLATGDIAGRARLWSLAERATLAECDHGSSVTAIALSADGTTAYSGTNAGRVWCWGTHSSPEPLCAAPGRVEALAISPGGNCLAIATRDGVVSAVESGSGTNLWSIRIESAPKCLSFDASGSIVLVGDYASRVTLISIADGCVISEWLTPGVKGVIWDTASSDGAERVVCCSNRGDLGLCLRQATGAVADTSNWVGHKCPVLRVAFANDGNTVCSFDNSGRAALWRTADGRMLQGFPYAPSATHLTSLCTQTWSVAAVVGSTGPEGTVSVWHNALPRLLATAIPSLRSHDVDSARKHCSPADSALLQPLLRIAEELMHLRQRYDVDVEPVVVGEFDIAIG